MAVVDAQGRVQPAPGDAGPQLRRERRGGRRPRRQRPLVLNPSDSLAEGDKVQVAPEEPRPANAGRPKATRMKRTGAATAPPAAACWPAALAAGCAVEPPTRCPMPRLPGSWKLEAALAREHAQRHAGRKGPWWKRFGDAALDTLQAQAWPAARRWPSPMRGWRRPVPALTPPTRPACTRKWAWARAPRARRSRPTGRSPTTRAPTSRPCRTTSRCRSTRATRSTWPAACSAASRARGPPPSNRPPTWQNVRLVLSADLATATTSTCASWTSSSTCWRARSPAAPRAGAGTARHDLGATSGLDVAQQQALLETTLTQVDVLRSSARSTSTRIATLTGTPAPASRCRRTCSEIKPPAVPLGVPSEMLQRRPDVASAERAMAAANAQIGVAARPTTRAS
jgi:multidrug efflux system outer membrane protein